MYNAQGGIEHFRNINNNIIDTLSTQQNKLAKDIEYLQTQNARYIQEQNDLNNELENTEIKKQKQINTYNDIKHETRNKIESLTKTLDQTKIFMNEIEKQNQVQLQNIANSEKLIQRKISDNRKNIQTVEWQINELEKKKEGLKIQMNKEKMKAI